jgi:hypothetical protein
MFSAAPITMRAIPATANAAAPCQIRRSVRAELNTPPSALY